MSSADPQLDGFDPALDRLRNLVGCESWAAITRQYKDMRVSMAEDSLQTTELLPESPTPDYVLSVHGSDCEVAGDWTGAEAAYRAILDWPDAAAMVLSLAHHKLSRLCEMLARPSEALTHAREATRACRLTDLEMLLAMYLAMEAQCLLCENLLVHADACIDEMFSLLPADSLWDHLRARAHVLRAKCELVRGNLEQAEANVARAMELLEPQASWTDAGGVQATIAACWSVKAQVLAARDDHTGAVAAWREAVRISRLTATEPRLAGVYPSYSLANTLRGLQTALDAAGLLEESREVACERAEMLKRLGLPLT